MRVSYQPLRQELKRVLLALAFPGARAEQCASLFAGNSRDGGYTHGLNRHLGPGLSNAAACLDRAIALASAHGIGCVALRNTNHWMRGGTYGWQAAEAGCIGLCFTNTIANVTPWGGTDARLGNNPLVLAVLSGGRSTADITHGGQESGVSQCFICSRQPALHGSVIAEIPRFTKSSPPGPGGTGIFYPGEQSLATRTAMAQGMPVNEAIWEQVSQM